MPDLANVERICLEALALPIEERSFYLQSACPDEATRREVESLLGAEQDARSIFPTLASVECDEGLADYGTTGVYEIQEKLADGGMGVVFRARQSAPVVRDVALKIVRPGMASRQLLARFLMERQALAIMDHPNIARVLDAGETSRGLPYLVMELVNGRTISRYCDENGLGVRERIELMIQVCQAIQHAHQKGIIHRDIKPSNVLVAVYDGKAVPKVIDFGIAKATESLGPAAAEATRAGMMLGTLEYVSPEQAEPGLLDVDTRADVYSLGALLYVLICGKTPIQGLTLDHLTYTEILRRIREEIPILASRQTGKPELRELDWILAKALEKDRERRYQSADGLARDLRRFLDGEPLEAAPPSAAYRLGKVAVRFKYWIAAAAVLIGLLLAGFVVMAFALRQQTRANSAAAALRDVVRRIIIERPAQLAEIPNRTALRAQLMQDAESALNALSQEARGDRRLQLELAGANLQIGLAKGTYNAAGSEGDPAGAAVYVRRAVELYSELARQSPNEADVRRGQIEALSTWLHLQYRLVRTEEGVKVARQLESEIAGMSAEMREKVQARWYLSICNLELGGILWAASREREALALHRKALSSFQGTVPADWMKDPAKLEHLSHLQRELAISMWMFEGPSADTEITARHAVAVVEGCAAANCRMRHAQSQGTLGELEWASGKRLEGIATMRKSVAEFEGLSAEDPANAVYAASAATVRGYLALALAAGPRPDEAVALARKNLLIAAAADARLDKGRERIMVYQVSLGAVLVRARRYPEAIGQLRETLDGNSDWNANHDLRWSALHMLAAALSAQGNYEEAVRAAKDEMKFAGDDHGTFSVRVIRAIAARDYAFAIANWKGSSPAERAEASSALDLRCPRNDDRRGVLAGALIESLPGMAEVAAIRASL